MGFSLKTWGRGDILKLPAPEFLQGSMRLGEIVFALYRFFIIIIAVVVANGRFQSENQHRSSNLPGWAIVALGRLIIACRLIM